VDIVFKDFKIVIILKDSVHLSATPLTDTSSLRITRRTSCLEDSMESRLKLKHFIGYIYSDETKEIDDRDPSKVDVPDGHIGFFFFDQIVGVVILDGKEISLLSNAINRSPNHFYGGQIYTIKEMREKFPDQNDAICNNAERNGCKYLIQTRTGSWHYFREGDVYLLEKVD